MSVTEPPLTAIKAITAAIVPGFLHSQLLEGRSIKRASICCSENGVIGSTSFESDSMMSVIETAAIVHHSTSSEAPMPSVAQDLARIQQPVNDLFGSVISQEQSSNLRLTADQVAFFHEQGYVSGIRVLSDEQIDVLRRELNELTQPNHPGSEYWYEYNSNESLDPARVLFHALGAWRIKPGFHDLLWNAACLVPASQLLGGAVRFWHDQLFCKPAHHGGVVAWHQDYSYWTRTRPIAHLTCWIGLDDSTRDNGCVQYVPGSHRWDLLPITGLAGDMDAIKQALNEEQWEAFQQPHAVELRAGECSFHHPLMVHGSYENRTDRQRRAVVLNYCKDGVCSASDEPLLAGADVVPSGQPLGGRFYPLLYSPHSRSSDLS